MANVAFVGHGKTSTNKVSSGSFNSGSYASSSNNIKERDIPAGFVDERSQEGAPSTRELGESSSSAISRTLPVTGEPLHHTVPLLAARLVRHEDRLDDIVDILDEFPREHIENLADEVENLMIGQLAMEAAFGHVGTRLEETIETIAALGDVLFLRHMVEDSQARDRARDQTVEILMDMVVNLQLRLDDAPGGP
ncbi:hypothetical protein CTI12_AA514240 [Artemisia annua]|uniref:Uncharacterized protein n=1 Tax=Artemisia annua TaxID=35608 RepID=A0A2U1L9Z6_ARTAN|nr:hypothetical protein CTI12_AA514240 [Artemisia annua]